MSLRYKKSIGENFIKKIEILRKESENTIEIQNNNYSYNYKNNRLLLKYRIIIIATTTKTIAST